jgi:hypothetical protein
MALTGLAYALIGDGAFALKRTELPMFNRVQNAAHSEA